MVTSGVLVVFVWGRFFSNIWVVNGWIGLTLPPSSWRLSSASWLLPLSQVSQLSALSGLSGLKSLWILKFSCLTCLSCLCFYKSTQNKKNHTHKNTQSNKNIQPIQQFLTVTLSWAFPSFSGDLSCPRHSACYLNKLHPRGLRLPGGPSNLHYLQT